MEVNKEEASRELSGTNVVPSKRNQRYDRQLRLWGDHGQDALYNASVCCIGAGAVATETLKNLVLPGYGGFTIVDDKKVTAADCGNNFFVSTEWIGKSRAQCATELLMEMNDEVKGEYLEKSAESILKSDPGFFNKFTVVITTNMNEEFLLTLSKNLWKANIPLLVAKAYGQIGFMRVAVREHLVVESHAADEVKADSLRLMKPIPEFVEYSKQFDLETMSNDKYAHTPYAVVIHQYLEKWKAQNGNPTSINFKAKKEIRTAIKTSVRPLPDPMVAENFVEAEKAIIMALQPVEIPSQVTELLEHEEAKSLNSNSDDFWVLVHALSKFVEANETLPIRGAIPDMTAESSTYIALQKIYRKKALDDVASITTTVGDVLESLGRPSDSISDFKIQTFCKNAAHINMVATRSLEDEYSQSDSSKSAEIDQELANPESNVPWGILLRAAEKFKTVHGYYPGHFDEQVEDDIPKLKESVATLLEGQGINTALNQDYIHEMCRYGASEIHSIASFVGGVAAQEIIKLVTRQYIPFNNTFIYNGMTSTSTTFQM